MKRVSLLVLLALIFTTPALAQPPVRPDVPVAAGERGQLGVGVNYEWFSPEEGSAEPTFKKEFTVGAYGAWNLIPEVDAVGFLKYGLDNQFANAALGLRYVIDQGALWQLGAGVNYEWTWGGDYAPFYEKQFTVGLYGSRVLQPWLVGVAFSKYGLDNREFNTALGLRVPLGGS